MYKQLQDQGKKGVKKIKWPKQRLQRHTDSLWQTDWDKCRADEGKLKWFYPI